MSSRYSIGAAVSSVVLQLSAFFFLRWIPGHHFPPVVITSLVLYLLCFRKVLGDPKAGADQPTRSANKKKKKQDSAPPSSPPSSSTPRPSASGDAQPLWLGIKTLMIGAPDPAHPRWSWVGALKNLVLAAIVLDVVVRGPLLYPSHDLSFLRTGHVSDTTARILVREPDQAKLPMTLELLGPTWSGTGPWKPAGTINETRAAHDFTAALTIEGLEPGTRYQLLAHSGAVEFTTAPPPGTLAPRTGKFSFLSTSCLKPRFPWTPALHPLAIPGLAHLAAVLATLDPFPSFMLFLGDFIYIDVPFRFGSGPRTYRAEYRRVYASPSWRDAAQSLPWIHAIDDHEIANDWDRGLAPPYPAALDPFALYHAAANPPAAVPNSTATAFVHGPASFFVLDTRRHRDPSAVLPATHPNKTMLGAAQRDAVLAWLARPEPPGVRWKVLASSVPLTRNWRANAADTWAGYLAERQALLEAAWDVQAARPGVRVVVLSGDRHEFAATRFPAPVGAMVDDAAGEGGERRRWPAGTEVVEFSCSPLSMFYLPLRTYWEVKGEQSGVGEGGEDQCIAYRPDGNSKFGAVEIEGGAEGIAKGRSTLRYRLFVNGRETWSYVLTTGEA